MKEEGRMKKLFTIGTKGLNNDRFASVLRVLDVDVVIDVRLRTEGPRYRFASGANIQRTACATAVQYLHEPRFGSTPELLRGYLANRDWDAYVTAYRALIGERNMVEIWREVACGFERPLLLGIEKAPGQCHCRLLGDHLAGVYGVEVVHL